MWVVMPLGAIGLPLGAPAVNIGAISVSVGNIRGGEGGSVGLFRVALLLYTCAGIFTGIFTAGAGLASINNCRQHPWLYTSGT
jgi:hypothetical protein